MDHPGIRAARHVRLMATLAVLLASVVLGACDPREGGSPDEATSPIPHEPLQVVTAAEAAQAEATLRESGVIERINGGQPWTVDLVTTSRSGTQKIGVYMSVSWDEPVSSDGPWKVRLCQETIVDETPVLWHNLTAVSISVALKDAEILLLMPGETVAPENRGRPPIAPTPYPDLEARKSVPPLPTCPEGLEDD